jgi:hypothetical protein
LPRAHRALGDQHLGDATGVLAFDLGKIALADPDHDLVPGGDDLEQGNLVCGKGGLDHNALHDEGGCADTEQQTFGNMHFEIHPCLRAGTAGNHPTKQKPRATSSWSHGVKNRFECYSNYFGCSFNAAELMQ